MYKLKKIFLNNKFIFTIWTIVPLIAAIKHATRGIFNDYLIFISSFKYFSEQINMYEYYPELNGWSFIYGPIFSLLIAPFTVFPDYIGTIFWDVSMNLVLFFAIYYLPLTAKQKIVILYFSLVALYSNAVNSQTNALISALILGSFILVKKEKLFWAACFIALGTFVKLYGIVGLIFIFFCKGKKKLVFYFVLWSIVFFVLPMLFSSPSYILQSYEEWILALKHKNTINLLSANQDISIMGIVRRISGNRTLSNIYFIVPAALLFVCQFVNKNLFSNSKFQINILAITLMSVVLFSSGSEHCTYIIAVVGALIWIVNLESPYSKIQLILVIILIIIELMIVVAKNTIRSYSLEALPFFLIWIYIVCTNYSFILSDFKKRFK